ncbi:MAG: phenylalanine--tRNA ligase subunit alpha [Candidatus Hydrogenedentes bacterium]|nr:phenylalanine--tRNA ligase subunit alpha [Candidatus Hydrogenedentota bacterium]
MAKTDQTSSGKIESLQQESLAAVEKIADAGALEEFRVKWLGRKGVLTDVLRGVSEAPPEERPALGKAANALKVALSEAIATKKAALQSSRSEDGIEESIDFSLPGRIPPRGHLHVITQVTDEIVDIFSELGYQVATGPDIETEYYNFDSLNTPADHPARDSHDTFYVKPGVVLRTHTSPVQMRVMEKVKPPVAVIAPGRVYRVDYDASHSPMFFQIEGLLVDEGVTFADLKGTLHHFIHKLFGKDVKLRFRPHFFPFTEPSAEVDILWTAKDRKTGETKSQWLEILGCGMVHPEVFRSAGYDYEKYSGFAFGLGIDRIAMVKHSIPNIHYLFENDLRFLEQF